jgi:hypothetical protein
MSRLDRMAFVVPFSILRPYVIWLVLESEKEFVLVAVAAQVAPYAQNRIGREDVLVRRHDEFGGVNGFTFLDCFVFGEVRDAAVIRRVLRSCRLRVAGCCL